MAAGSFSKTSTRIDVGKVNKMDLIKMTPDLSQPSANMEVDLEQDADDLGDIPSIEMVDQVLPMNPIASRKTILKKTN